MTKQNKDIEEILRCPTCNHKINEVEQRDIEMTSAKIGLGGVATGISHTRRQNELAKDVMETIIAQSRQEVLAEVRKELETTTLNHNNADMLNADMLRGFMMAKKIILTKLENIK